MEAQNESQLRAAIVEDDIVDFVLKHYPNFVMHGGTAVWRCYGGNRFSRDVDFYSNITPAEESTTQKQLHKLLTDNGYPIREEKYNNKTKTLHLIFKSAGTTGKLDISFMSKKGVAVEYQRVDGSKRMILTLSPEELLGEKIDAYSNKYEAQSHEIQDLYDMFVLKGRIGNPSKEIRKKLSAFIGRVKNNPPKDEKRLNQLLLKKGVVPTFADLIRFLEQWLDDAGK